METLYNVVEKWADRGGERERVVVRHVDFDTACTEQERLRDAQAEPATSVFEIERVDGKRSFFMYVRST